jgi:hypothetical protein
VAGSTAGAKEIEMAKALEVGDKVQLAPAYAKRVPAYAPETADWKSKVDFGFVTRVGKTGGYEVLWTLLDGTTFTGLWYAKSNLRTAR